MNIRKIIAFILLVVDVLAVLYLGYSVGENRAWGVPAFIGKPEEDVFLTVNKDVETTYRDETVLIPKGSVVKAESIHRDMVGFYFSKSGMSFEEINKIDDFDLIPDAPELGILYVHLTNDCFEEQAELERMNKEAKQRSDEYRKQCITKALLISVGVGLCWSLLIFLLLKKEMYVLTYVIENIFVLIVIFICPIFLLFH